MKEELIALIIETLQGMSEDREASYTGETALMGNNKVVDSLGLVSLIAAVEQAIDDRYNVLVTLADEKAFSQRTSPFLTIASMAEYAAQRIRVEER